MTTALIGNCSLQRLQVHGDARGTLVALERASGLPFAVKRVYYLYGTEAGAERGFHAHRELQQLAICVNGACTFTLDDGMERQEVRLDSPDVALWIRSMVWREMRGFSRDCVLLVLASAEFSEADYIRDYDTFLRSVKEGTGSGRIS